LRLHFGLGSRTQVDKVEVFWPSGKVETITDLAVDHSYEIKESQGIVPLEKNRSIPIK
jgi:hypothetical protein